jgi:nucleotide-binding universal stress UspA family protein
MTSHNPGPLRVLAAVDFSDASAAALALAARLAGGSGGTVTALHAEAIEMPPYFTGAQIDRLEADRRDARAAAADYLRGFAERHAGMPVATLVVDGPAAEAIVRQASDFDLVVVGTHGRRGPRRWWLGSVAEAVVARSPVPVVVTRAVHDSTSERTTV